MGLSFVTALFVLTTKGHRKSMGIKNQLINIHIHV
jgi:hypothetical protein